MRTGPYFELAERAWYLASADAESPGMFELALAADRALRHLGLDEGFGVSQCGTRIDFLRRWAEKLTSACPGGAPGPSPEE